VLNAFAIMVLLAAITGLALLAAARRLPQNQSSPVELINDLLPQTQCAQCGYPGCRPYAEAIVAGNADINQCAPGGDALVSELARLLGKTTVAVDPAFGMQNPGAVVYIDEDTCIGCAICLDACPVDAILGAHRFTHTIIRSECTGCELCIAPCPVDCITLEAPEHRHD
jgi:electron transport complex protein RnfB